MYQLLSLLGRGILGSELGDFGNKTWVFGDVDVWWKVRHDLCWVSGQGRRFHSAVVVWFSPAGETS